MKLAVIGTGYVGLVTGTCFADMGNDVWCIDIDEKKIEGLKNGVLPIYEPGLDELVKRNYDEGRLRFTTNLKEGIAESTYAFIAVGTPSDEDGSADLQHVLDVARQIGRCLEKYIVIVDKSTVPVGTAEKVRQAVREELDKQGKKDISFDVVSNPEFLKEGNAVEDFIKPDRVIIGADNARAADLMRDLYSTFVRKGDRVMTMDIPSAELTKYAANAMLATRISFMNELSHLCEASGADIESVRRGIGSDSRIGTAFLYAGIGYGGSCFPKDVKALIYTLKDFGFDAKILSAVEEVNKEQRRAFVSKVVKHMGENLNGKTFAVWGLAFKPQTDDMREAPAIDIITELRKRGASFKAYDPIAVDNARHIIGDEKIEYVKNNYDTLKGADALLLLTEWHHFRKPDFDKIKSLMKAPVIFDGRNQYEPAKMKEMGFRYYSIGRN
ncbi:MAG TPA: UDP-glucose/GDP-mannose dehydrogenase family protein [Spirochaetota bacterium]|nr:UDP-glucose/GDP-mannose dehydrogenase family protein [Spirochaetota bacterium]HPL16562.1 UDP-glucose/GDP-mannose dehydrogenase family protein [Spirochaetota bacterium]HQF06633.1 UDP-glucose/GDP-mannose dehydrogenase family protein [Spirochaetota bacterium]HQH95964.1 UDP-glucose/GDP-mannose dehydrogenase family protein [Spirochaetota bacterium]HQJ70282.1 UDP-glucose/GDP-mannose dehydrogenase family protein [Spirochaetota bacterium]